MTITTAFEQGRLPSVLGAQAKERSRHMARAACMLFRATSTDDKPLTALFHWMQKFLPRRCAFPCGSAGERGRDLALRKAMTHKGFSRLSKLICRSGNKQRVATIS